MSSVEAEWLERSWGESEEPWGEGREYLYARGFTDSLIHTLGAREWAPATAPPEGFDRGDQRALRWAEGALAIPMRSPAGTLTGVWFRAWAEKTIRLVKAPGRESLPTGFNLAGALNAGWLGGAIWVVEGVFDLSAVHWALGPEDGVFAAGRAGMSPATRRALARFARGPVRLAYDNDEAGRMVMYGGEKDGKTFPPLGASLRREGLQADPFVYRGKDPGEIWKRGGAEAIRQEFRWH